MADRRVRAKKRTKPAAALPEIQPNAAGIDCGAQHHYVAVPADRDRDPSVVMSRLRAWRVGCRAVSLAWRRRRRQVSCRGGSRASPLDL